MANRYKNDTGFLIIEMDYKEATEICEFGFQPIRGINEIVCDNCNSVINEDEKIYYFSVLNRAMCKECCDDIIANQTRYPEDIPYEKRHYNFYAKRLNLEEV